MHKAELHSALQGLCHVAFMNDPANCGGGAELEALVARIADDLAHFFSHFFSISVTWIDL